MTAHENDARLLGTFETHHVAAQPVEVLMTRDGEVITVAGLPYWTDNPFTVWDGDIWWIENEEWGDAKDIHRWLDADENGCDGLGFEVACGDVPSLTSALRALIELRALATAERESSDPARVAVAAAMDDILAPLAEWLHHDEAQ